MSTKTYVSNDTAVSRPTLTQLFFEAVDRYGADPAFGRFREDLSIEEIPFADVMDRARRVAGALEAHGVTRGDRAAIMSINRLEWALADYGCLCAGVIDVPIYATLTAPQVAYILRDSGAKLIFVPHEEQMKKAMEARAECGHAIQIVVFDPPAELPEDVISWDAFLEDGARVTDALTEEQFRVRALQAGPDDVATVLYTSGTTGDPKGVMLTHGNVGSNVKAASLALEIGPGDTTVSFLPLSHIFQRMVDFLFMSRGGMIIHARTMLSAVDDMGMARPTVGIAVPRVYEKVHAAVMDARGLKRKIITWAVGVADRVAEVRLAGYEPRGLLASKYGLADRLVFSKVRERFGGRVKFFVSGSAPLSPALNRFFYSIGLPILEGYGLTETSPVTNVNTFEDFRIGTVGKAVANTEIKIAHDGEILVRGPQVMKGYYNRPEATAEAIDAEGWFYTGDIGELDEDGYLRITDRKKDIIVTAGGKNVAPQPIENRVKDSAFVEQVVMVGDRRKFTSLLIVPSFPALEAWASDLGLSWDDHGALVELPEVKRHMEAEVRRGFQGLASYEIPKKIAILREDFTIANGCLTPTLKVKRRVIQDRFQSLIDGLYDDSAGQGHR
jgi:long-chain acyl-CoA synthetase